MLIFALGFIAIMFGAYNLTDHAVISTVTISVGTSLVATSVSNFLYERAQNTSIEDLAEAIEGKASETSIEAVRKRTDKIYRAVREYEPNQRILQGKHLKDVFRTMINEEVSSDDSSLYIDVIGMELFNFWKDQGQYLIDHYPNFRMRLIVQDPMSVHFDDMVLNEQASHSAITRNIYGLTENIMELKKKLKRSQNIEIRWIYFPASATITRVNNQLYIRTRLIDSNHSEGNFFERYENGDEPFEYFLDYFENAWNQWDDNKYMSLTQAKQDYTKFLSDPSRYLKLTSVGK